MTNYSKLWKPLKPYSNFCSLLQQNAAVAPTIKAEEKTSSSMESTKSFIYTWCSKFEVSKSSSCQVKYRPIHPKLEHLLIMYYSCQVDIDSYTLENLLIMYYSCQVEYRLIYPRKSLLDHIIADSSPWAPKMVRSESWKQEKERKMFG